MEFVYPACLPVYELRLRIVELETDKLSTAASFVLMLANVPVTEVSEIRRLLGLSERDVVTASAELLSALLVVQQPDQRILITAQGRAVLREGGRTYRPRNRHPRMPYDPLVRAVVGIDLDDLLDREEVRRQGLFIPPTKPRRPRLSQIQLPEVQDYEEHFGKARHKAEILQVSDIKDIRLRYRADVVLVKTAAQSIAERILRRVPGATVSRAGIGSHSEACRYGYGPSAGRHTPCKGRIICFAEPLGPGRMCARWRYRRIGRRAREDRRGGRGSGSRAECHTG